MTLLCLLCVSLVLGGWAVRREARAVFEDLWLHFFGVRIRVHRRPETPRPDRVAVPVAPPCPLPPPQVTTRPGP